jgi:hypothetical protein
MDVFTQLKAPIDPKRVSWRVGSTNADKTKGLALAYIDARDVMERLDAVVGPASWQDRYEVHGSKTICYLSILIDGNWITKADAAGDSDVEAEKGAISDSFKRAAVKWGVGRYLYDLDSPWVALEAAGRSYRIPKSEHIKLEALLSKGVQAPPRVESLEVKTAAAIKAAKHLVMQFGDFGPDARDFRADNADLIARVKAYPEAEKILEDGGVL